MSDEAVNPPNPAQQLTVTIAEDVKKGTYSNAISVNVNSNEVVVDFGYLLPNTDKPEILVVSRINMNHSTAESFLKVLTGAMEDFKKKQADHEANLRAGGTATNPNVNPNPSPAPMPAVNPAPMPPMPNMGPMPAPNPFPAYPDSSMPMPPLPENA